MEEVQVHIKTITVKTCEDIIDLFLKNIQSKCWHYDKYLNDFEVYMKKSNKNVSLPCKNL